jgi:hypothetical protein
VAEPCQFFSLQFRKIFNSLGLWLPDRRFARQNPKAEGLTSKTLWNKELADGFGPLFRAGVRKILDWLELRSEGRAL